MQGMEFVQLMLRSSVMEAIILFVVTIYQFFLHKGLLSQIYQLFLHKGQIKNILTVKKLSWATHW